MNRLLPVIASFALVGCAQIIGATENPTVLPPSCKGTLSVRIASDFSGTATDIAIPYFFGIYDHLRALNARGGVLGCQIDVQTSDNQYTNAGTQAVVDQWRQNDPKWSEVNTVFVFGTGPTSTVAAGLAGEGKVIIPGSYAGKLASPVAVNRSITYPVVNESFLEGDQAEQKESPGFPFVFYPATDYATGIRLAIQSAWQIAPGRMAMAHETADKCAYCVEPLAAGKSYIGNLSGMSLGRDLIIPQTSNASDGPAIETAVRAYFQKEIDQVKANATYKPVTWVWSGNSVMASSLLGQALWKVQTTMIDTDLTIPSAVRTAWKLRVIANNWGIGETTPSICGDACNHDNFYGLFPVPKYGDIQNSAAMATIIATHDEFAAKDTMPNPPIPARRSSDFRDVRYVQGYAAALMWQRGIEAAIKAGHRAPTGADLKAAFETFSSEALDGATAAPISFSPADHRPQSAMSIYKLDANGQLVFVNRYNLPLVADWLGW